MGVFEIELPLKKPTGGLRLGLLWGVEEMMGHWLQGPLRGVQ